MSTTEAFGDLHYVFCSCVVQTFKCTPTHKGHLRVEPVFSQHHFVLQTLIFFHQGLKRRISVPGRVHFLNTFLSAAQEVVRSTPPVHLELKKSLYLFRFSSRISAPLLLLMLLSSDLTDSSAAFTSAATDLSQLFRRLHTQTRGRI